jgi:Glycosyltransferase 61
MDGRYTMIGSPESGSTDSPTSWTWLEPRDFSFHGFGTLRPDERRKISKLGIRRGAPAVTVVPDAIFVPNLETANTDQSKVIGGIVGPDGQPIERAQLHRKGGKHFGGLSDGVTVTAEDELDEDIVYLGPLFNHYGRILLESLARIWYLSEVDPSVKVGFNSTTEKRDAQLVEGAYRHWVFELLSLFGIARERIFAPEAPTRLRRAIVPEPLFEQHFSAHVDMARPFREVAARVAADVVPSEQPLYLSRRRLTSAQRPVVGEAELEDLLRAQGFAIAHPETMTFEDQIRLINSHLDIFSAVGSAAHTILFALGKPRLHLLAHRDSIPANFFLCSVVADAPTTFVNCLGSGDRRSFRAERSNQGAERFETRQKDPVGDSVVGPQAEPQLLELDRVVTYLEQQGFLRHQSPSTMPGPVSAASIRRQFNEAWYYARLRKTSRKRRALPADLEHEALVLASESWPLSYILAVCYARVGDRSRADALANQFATLVDAESDADRLEYYRFDIHGMAKYLLPQCEPETANRLAAIVATRFPEKGSPDLTSGQEF